MTDSVGVSHPRQDGPAQVNGQTIFSFDFAEPGTLCGKILRSKVASGRIVRLNVDKARKMPGVRGLVTASDVPDVLAGWIIRDTPMFARDRIRYVGEPIAAIAADTLDEARRALDVIEVEIEQTTPVC